MNNLGTFTERVRKAGKLFKVMFEYGIHDIH